MSRPPNIFDLTARVSDNRFEEVIRDAVNRGVDINMGDSFGGIYDTLLHKAVLAENIHRARILLRHGANPNVKNRFGGSLTPLHEAVRNRSAEMSDLLLQYGADVNSQTSNLDTPLYYAVRNNNTQIAALLIRHGANVNITNKAGKSPFS
jgi:26S proteasome non-ATPase regulatory subunit 10